MMLRDVPHATMVIRAVPEMAGFRVVLSDGKTLYMSVKCRSLYDSECGNVRLKLLACPVVEFRGRIEKYLTTCDKRGMVRP